MSHCFIIVLSQIFIQCVLYHSWCFLIKLEGSSMIFHWMLEVSIFSRDLANEPPHGKTNNLHMRKQRRRTAKLISAFVFATRIVQFLFFLNPKFQASSSFLCLYRLVCVGPVWKPHCWFSHEAAQMWIKSLIDLILSPLTLVVDRIHWIRQSPSGKHLCNVYPLEPHFYIGKMGYAGVNLFFLFLLQNIDCGYSLEPPRRGGSNVYPQSMFWAKVRKISKNFCWIFSILTLRKIYKLHGRVFIMQVFLSYCIVVKSSNQLPRLLLIFFEAMSTVLIFCLFEYTNKWPVRTFG